MSYENLWAPWRIQYLKSLDDSDRSPPDCFLCRYWSHPEHDAENLVLWRTENAMVLFNRFPYSAGHLLIAPAAHVGQLHLLDENTRRDFLSLACDAQTVLAEAIHPQGFNLGININRPAGAGLPDHVHMHVVPRWAGDTNFMTTCADTRLVSQSLDELYRELADLSRRLNLPNI